MPRLPHHTNGTNRGHLSDAPSAKSPSLITPAADEDGRCTLDIDIHDELLARAELGHAGAAIARYLSARFGPRAPHRNTVYAEMRRHAPDRGGAWTLADDEYDAVAARLVLEELAHVYELSGGRVWSFTKREAWWIARLKSINNTGAQGFDPLEPGEAFRMARNHVVAERRGEQLSPWLDTLEANEARLRIQTRTPRLFAPKEEGK